MKSVAVVAALMQLVAVADAFAVAGRAPLRSARVAPQMSVGASLASLVSFCAVAAANRRERTNR